MAGDPHDLERLAAKGRAERAKHAADDVARHEAEVQYENQKEAAERRATFRASCSWAGAFYSSGMAYVLYVLTFIGPTLFGSSVLHMKDAHAILYLTVPIASAITLWMGFGLFIAPGRERAWVKTLPFVVRYYEPTLGVYPRHLGEKIALSFAWGGTAPTGEQLCDILGSDGGVWKLGSHGYERSTINNWDSGTNISVRNWFHRFAGKQLATLHAAYPIRSVRLVTLQTLGKEFVERARHTGES